MLLFLRVHRVSATFFALAGIGSAFRTAAESTYAASPVVAALMVFIGLLAIAFSIKRDLPFNRVTTRFLGLATYPLYLIHDALGTVVMESMGVSWPSLLAALVIVLATSFLVLRGERLIRSGIGQLARANWSERSVKTP